jgi:predicted Zn-dependent protease
VSDAVGKATAQELVDLALRSSGADSCIVIAEEVTEANIRWANNTLTTNGVTRGRDMTVISFLGDSVGVVTDQAVTADSVVALVESADAVARTAPKAEDAAPLFDASAGSETGDWDAPAPESSIGVFAKLAPALGDAFGRSAAAGELLFGYAEHRMSSIFLSSSTGLRLRHDQPTAHIEMNAKSPDFERTAWAGVPTVDFTDVDVHAMTADLSKRLGWAERSVDLPPGRYDTLLPPTAVADLMIDLYWSAGGLDAHDGRTVFSRAGGGTRVGERLTDLPISLRSDPGAVGVSCTPFVVTQQSSAADSVFDNGGRLQPTSWIHEGALTSLVQTRRSAATTGLPFTPYIDNLIVDGPATTGGSLDDMVGRMERGLLLTCLWYIREVDPQTLLLTGLTRDGVYLVENGEVTSVVNNFRFNESPVDLLRRTVHCGESVRTLPREWRDYFTRTTMPPLRVPDFNMSSVSRAF